MVMYDSSIRESWVKSILFLKVSCRMKLSQSKSDMYF